MKTKLKKQSKLIEDKQSKQLGIKSVIDIFDKQLPQKAKDMLIKLGSQEKKYQQQKA